MGQASFVEIARILFWMIFAIFGFLGYVTKVRVVVEHRHGRYYKGLADGAILTLLIMAIIFYVQSFIVV